VKLIAADFGEVVTFAWFAGGCGDVRPQRGVKVPARIRTQQKV
jgi:hypothetical protein